MENIINELNAYEQKIKELLGQIEDYKKGLSLEQSEIESEPKMKISRDNSFQTLFLVPSGYEKIEVDKSYPNPNAAWDTIKSKYLYYHCNDNLEYYDLSKLDCNDSSNKYRVCALWDSKTGAINRYRIHDKITGESVIVDKEYPIKKVLGNYLFTNEPHFIYSNSKRTNLLTMLYPEEVSSEFNELEEPTEVYFYGPGSQEISKIVSCDNDLRLKGYRILNIEKITEGVSLSREIKDYLVTYTNNASILTLDQEKEGIFVSDQVNDEITGKSKLKF